MIKKFLAIQPLLVVMVAIQLSLGNASAQTPQYMSYQAVIRNSSDALVSNSAVGLQVSILQGSEEGEPVYVERHFHTTNANGLVSTQIGSGTVVSGNFASIDWSLGLYFIKTETDIRGGANYSITGISQLLSVPYSMYAQRAGAVDLSASQIELLKGDAGVNGADGIDGVAGKDGVNGADGMSAFEMWSAISGNETKTEADFISAHKGESGSAGLDGQSAYQIWKVAGNTGSEADFLLSLVGKDGVNGLDGASVYQIWLDAGNYGDEYDFVRSLKGRNGIAGKSSYQLWLDEGNEGTLSDFLAIKGQKGDAGIDGLSAYHIWVETGNVGTEADFLATLKGEKGEQGDSGETGSAGKSAYELWIDAGNTGTVSNFLTTKGEKGDAGIDGLTTIVNGIEQVDGAIHLSKSDLGLGNVDNTADLDKPINTATQEALDNKVDAVIGKGLSTNDFTAVEKTKLVAISGTNTGDQDLSGYATRIHVDALEIEQKAQKASIASNTEKVSAATGTQMGEMQYWDGSAWVSVTAGLNGQFLKNKNGVPTWSDGDIDDLSVGDAYKGGIIAYFFELGDTRFDPDVKHGIVASVEGLGLDSKWHNGVDGVSGATYVTIGSAHVNTTKIVDYYGSGSNAATICDEYIGYGFTDWLLPTKGELNAMYLNKDLIGGFVDAYYWSSSEISNISAWIQNFLTGDQSSQLKNEPAKVRPVRYF